MLKNNKLRLIISSVIILLPILFGIIMWNKLPDIMPIHWGVDGKVDGFGGKAFAVFVSPILLLISHFFLLFCVFLGKQQEEQNNKAIGIVFWVIPILSLFVNISTYSAVFGKKIGFHLIIPVMLGIVFIFIGNYLPKIKQNRTFGIRVSWTLNNEENWNKTHRFAGKLWFVEGLILLFSIFLPTMILITVCVIASVLIIPILYSYCIYRNHQKQGIVYITQSKSKVEKILVIIITIILSIIFISTAILMFTGNVKLHFEDTFFKINATYWNDIEIDYSEIDTIEYSEDFEIGTRQNGFASARLSMGIFKNEEIGSYTLYAYTKSKEFIVLKLFEKTIVIGMRDTNDAKAIYNEILANLDK